MKKKISFFIGSMGKGGAERVISILANYYAAQNFEVDIILLLSNRIEYKLDSRINIIDFSSNKNRIISSFLWIKKIRSYVKKEAPYKVITFIGRINLLVIAACVGLKVDIYCSERNDPNNDGRSKVLNKIIKKAYLHRNCKKVIFQTRYAQNYFPETVKQKSCIIYNPVEVYTKRRTPIHKIVSVGRLTQQKNQKLLIEAFSEIIKEYPDYKLFIYGEGELRTDLENQILKYNLTGKVFLPGNIDNIHYEISDAEIFVLPSKYEGLSNALLEAMILGIPCISTRVSGIEEIINDGKNGILVNNKKELVQAIKILLIDKEKYNYIAYNSIKLKKIFSLNSVANNWNYIMNISNE
ncbi:MAG: hypothetical protein DBY32_02090 [Phascolarctobacterium sp.]|nr:MAG: hypothetical protein DBY32_02090 [Phascolarctobacterium sp.]